MEHRILTCHLTCILYRGLSHEKWKFKLYMSIDGHFYYMYVFDGHDTRQIFALLVSGIEIVQIVLHHKETNCI